MANAILSCFELTNAEELSLAVCIDLAADLYSKNPHYSQYHQCFTNELEALVKFYYDEMQQMGAAPVDIIEVNSNYDYARIIKNVLLLMRRAPSFCSERFSKFIYTVKKLLDNASIIVEVAHKRYPIAHEYFSQQYDNLHRVTGELSHFVKLNKERRGGDDNRY
jgi:hypothetical protein